MLLRRFEELLHTEALLPETQAANFFSYTEEDRFASSEDGVGFLWELGTTQV